MSAIPDILAAVFRGYRRDEVQDAVRLMRFYSGRHGSGLRLSPTLVIVNWHGQVYTRTIRRLPDGREALDDWPPADGEGP